jgi:hypothetical protein
MDTSRIHRHLSRSSLLLLILIISCDDPTAPMGSAFTTADSVWIRLNVDGELWAPVDSADHFVSLNMDPTAHSLTLVGWSQTISNGILIRPDFALNLTNVVGVDEYEIQDAGPANISYTKTLSDLHRAIDGQVVLTVFDTTQKYEVQGSVSARLVSDNGSETADTIRMNGTFLARWRR